MRSHAERGNNQESWLADEEPVPEDEMEFGVQEVNRLLSRLPPRIQKESVVDCLVSYASRFHERPLDERLFDKPIPEIFDYLNRVVLDLIGAEACFSFGDIISCYQKVYDILYGLLADINPSIEIPAGEVFYRMRESSSGSLYSSGEMFHVPFELRGRVANQRFSVSGHPSLYLGRSVYVCWEELGRPNFDTANIVALRTKRPLRLLDLRVPREILAESDLYRVPLALACAVKVKEPNLPFKPEYIIPQALLHAIINGNRDPERIEKYDGVIYYSTRIGDSQRLFDTDFIFENIVIPTVNRIDPSANAPFTEGFCPTLCKHFEVSPTISRSVQMMKDIFGPESQSARVGYPEDYERSILGRMENWLLEQDRWEDISPNKFFRSRPKELERY